MLLCKIFELERWQEMVFHTCKAGEKGQKLAWDKGENLRKGYKKVQRFGNGKGNKSEGIKAY
jgi:hypothetical protein